MEHLITTNKVVLIMTKENYTQEESEKLTEEIRNIVNSSYHGWHNKLKTRQDLLDFINYKTPLL